MREAGLDCTPCPEVRGHPWRLIGRHATPKGVSDQDGFSFAFVRHPLGWYRSFWAYRVMLRNFSPHDGRGVFPPDACWAADFEAFVVRCVEAHPSGWVSALYRCYLGDEGNRLDFAGRQECLTDDLVRALRLAGEAFDEDALRATPRRNKAASMPRFAGELDLDPEVAGRVLDCERWVMKRYYL